MTILHRVFREVNGKNLGCVPKHIPVSSCDIEKLLHFVGDSKKLLIVTGAGISTESGIPDYRSEGVGVYSRRVNFKPIQQHEFINDEDARKRYWLKNFIGWPTFSIKVPNATHYSLAELEKANRLSCVVTQNVDNLHYKALSRNVIELHGSAYRVKCLNCGVQTKREDFQSVLRSLNPHHVIKDFVMNPDGDVDIEDALVSDFSVPNCTHCDGLLQPDIVFFGGNVPTEIVIAVNDYVEKCDALLVLGSTLKVFSSYRIALKAAECNKPIAIVNIGQTRGDSIASLRINARCGEILPVVCEELLKK